MAPETRSRRRKRCAMDEFVLELQREEARRKRAVVMLEDPDSEEESLEKLRALRKVFVPKGAREEYHAVAYELGQVGMDPDFCAGGWTMRGLTTKDSYEGHAILNHFLLRLAGLVITKKWQQAFNLAFGITLAGLKDSFWFTDTEITEEVEAIFKKLKAAWRAILAQPDRAIGADADVRAKVHELMKSLRDDIMNAEMVEAADW